MPTRAKSLHFILPLCFAVAAAPLPAQEGTFFSEFVEVTVTNVDVIVTDAAGRPVTGLARDDFEILEDGVVKEVSNFVEMRGSGTPQAASDPGQDLPIAAAEDIRRRDITIFIDNAVLHPLTRNQILPQLNRFIEKTVRPGDSVGIAVWGRSLKIELEPTSSRELISAALEQLKLQTTFGASESLGKEEFFREVGLLINAYADRGEKPPWFTGVSAARTHAMRVAHALNQRVEAVKSLIAWRRGSEGRKILVLITTEMPMNPAEEVFAHLDGIRDSFADANSMAMSEAREFQFPSLASQIAEVANSSGVTLYPIDASGKDSGMMQRDASSSPRFTTGGRIETAAPMATLHEMAAETGGIALTGSDNWTRAFDTIANDLESYYSLGYQSSGERKDRMKNIQVRLKDGRYKVRTRRAVVERSITSEMQDAVAANLFRPSSMQDLRIRATAGTATAAEGESVLVPVTVTIPMNELTLVPDGDELTGRFAVYAAFLRRDGAVSKVVQQPGSVRFPAVSLASRRELTVKIDVTMDNETDAVSIGVMDDYSRATGFASVKLR